VDTNRPFQFQKRGQLFVGAQDEPPTVAAMCVSNEIVRPLESTPETQPQLHPALLSLSAMISQDFTNPTPLIGVLNHLRRMFAHFKLRAHSL
jgi:hypothetical protein